MYDDFKIISFICGKCYVFDHITKTHKDGLYSAMVKNWGFPNLSREQFDSCWDKALKVLNFN